MLTPDALTAHPADNTVTAADTHAIVTDRLNAGNRRIRIDIGINGCRLHVAELGAGMYIEYISVGRVGMVRQPAVLATY